MTNPFVRPEKQLKYTQAATTGQTVAVPPAARSVFALLLGCGVADEDLDGVNNLLMFDPEFSEHVPTSGLEIVTDVRKAHAKYRASKKDTIDAV